MTQNTMSRPRVAVVRYLNAAPLFWGLLHGPQRDELELEFMVPSRCSEALRAGDVDGALMPSIEFQRIDRIRIVPGCAIGANGPVRSVLLISHCPIDEIQTLALDRASRTSACLAQVLLRHRYRVQPTVNICEPDLASRVRGGDATLLIGDAALVSAFPGLRVYDLGEEWREMTGLPFVFAFWALREHASERVAESIRASAAYGSQRINDIVRAEAQALGLPVSALRHYLTENLEYSLADASLEGLRTFYQLAHEYGFIDTNKPLAFVGS